MMNFYLVCTLSNGKYGTCELIKNCMLPKGNNVRRTLVKCGKEGYLDKYCCPVNEPSKSAASK